MRAPSDTVPRPYPSARANGQAKVTAKVCVNPHHYHPRKEREFVGLIDMLTTSLREMHLLPGDAALENIMNNAAHLPAEELFHAACSHIRQRREYRPAWWLRSWGAKQLHSRH